MSDDDTGDKSYEPSDQKLESFRKQGRFAKARDIGGVVATLAVLAVLSGTRDQLSQNARQLFVGSLGDLGALERQGVLAVLRGAGMAFAALAGTAVLAAVGASVVAGAGQARFKTYSELLTPDLSRLNPMGALKKLISPKRAASEGFVALLRVAVVAAAAYYALSSELPTLVSLARLPLKNAIPTMLTALGRTAGIATAALFLVGAVDYAQSWFTLSKELMMTRKEREDESKQSDGDPKAKAKQKAFARKLVQQRSLDKVKEADVIVTNPTHVAVALRYGPNDPAPVVLAKGHDDVALRIRAEARRHGIPILENRRLARALDAEVQVGRVVPAAHFAAVARVLAFVFKLRGRGISTKKRR